MRKRTENKGTHEKYLKFLNVLKNELTNNLIRHPHEFTKMHNVSDYWVPWLIKNKVIVGNRYEFYKWNDKIPVSIKLIELFRENVRDKSIEYHKKLKNKIQPELQFDMNYIEIPAEIKAKARAKSKTRTTKVKVQEPISIPTQQNEYGLIRKFLKWIY
jgi:hypothetical protein